MSPTAQQLLASALALPEAERAELVDALLDADEPPASGPVGEAWVAEIQRRSAELDAGTATTTPWAEVKRRVHARLGVRTDG